MLLFNYCIIPSGYLSTEESLHDLPIRIYPVATYVATKLHQLGLFLSINKQHYKKWLES